AEASTPAIPIRDPTSVIPTTQDYLTGTPQVGPSTGAGVGGFSSYYLASLGPEPGSYRHTLIRPEFPRGAFGRGGNGGESGAGTDASRPPLGGALQAGLPSATSGPGMSLAGVPGTGGGRATGVVAGGASSGTDNKTPSFTRFGASD